MLLQEITAPERIRIVQTDGSDAPKPTKEQAIAMLASLLSSGTHLPQAQIERVLLEREALQSTGIGEGVAIPHGAVPELEAQCASVLIIPQGLNFNAIDGLDVKIVFCVIGPKHATGQHLKTLAQISRLLKTEDFRKNLIAARNSRDAYAIIVKEEGNRR